VPTPRVVQPDLALAEPVPADAAPWWAVAGDPVLATMIAQGLAHDPALACSAWQLQADAAQANARRRHLGGRLAGLLGHSQVAEGLAPGAYAHAALVNRRAATMAEAYLAVRLAQARLAGRRAAVVPWQDNAEIARFRREAGLVSAIDGALGGVMVDLDADAVNQAQAELAQAVVAGKVTVDEARAALASATAAGNEDIDSAAKALAAARVLAEGSARTLAQAERTVRDARAGYRAGVETFATLYVAEASALAAAEADATARAGLARAQVRLWAARGLGWIAADLAPAAPDQAPAKCPAVQSAWAP
jgi:outer membrane protein TolC